MEFKIGTMIDLDGIECCVLEQKDIGGVKYIYVAEIYDEDITENFYIYKITDNKAEKVINSEELKQILPIFIESMSSEIGRN